MFYANPKPFPNGFLWGAPPPRPTRSRAPGTKTARACLSRTCTRRPRALPTSRSQATTTTIWRRTVALMAELGLKAYRFSISWSRVMPEGDGAVNEAGLAFYDRLVDALVAHDITPVATMFHFDLPLALHERGGWANRATVDAFERYARVLFERLGDRIKMWLTINEQNVMVIHPNAMNPGRLPRGARALPAKPQHVRGEHQGDAHVARDVAGCQDRSGAQHHGHLPAKLRPGRRGCRR